MPVMFQHLCWALGIQWRQDRWDFHTGRAYSLLIEAMNNYRDYTDIGEGNGTPLQYSCLENPMDGGAW